MPLPPKIDCEDLHNPLFIEDIYGYLWMASFQKNYENVYISLPKLGPRLRIPHVASLSVINRHIAPITISKNEMYKYVASNLDFTEKYKEKTAELGTDIEDVEKSLKNFLRQIGGIQMSGTLFMGH